LTKTHIRSVDGRTNYTILGGTNQPIIILILYFGQNKYKMKH